MEREGRIGRFSPNAEIAKAWHRLYKGNPTKQDLVLLKHEDFERRLEKLYKTTIGKAHDATVSERVGLAWIPAE